MATEATIAYAHGDMTGRFVLEATEEARDFIGCGFNPSGDKEIQRIKEISAVLVTELDSRVVSVPEGATIEVNDAARNRRLATARTHIETAAMFAVKALAASGQTGAASGGDPEGDLAEQDQATEGTDNAE